jgi:hypothetical protein
MDFRAVYKAIQSNYTEISTGLPFVPYWDLQESCWDMPIGLRMGALSRLRGDYGL